MIGWLTAPTGFASGIDRIDAALLGETAAEIIVAFRGTLPPQSPDTLQTILDWLNDCDAALVADPQLPGMVHAGFLGAVNDLWPGLHPAVQTVSTANPRKPVFVTGHSKGGAMASIAALLLRRVLTASVPVMVTTFAAAKPEDPDFAAGYDGIITHSVRYEFQDDIVPHVPPSDQFITMFKSIPAIADTVKKLTPGFVPVGDLMFIDWSNTIVPDSPVLRFHRFAHLAELMATLGYRTIIDDHSIDVNSGYDRAIT
jgi:hypothetical protein